MTSIICRLPLGLRSLFTSSCCSVSKIVVKNDGDTKIVEVVDVPEDKTKKFLKSDSNCCSFCTCKFPVKISYADVLILEQFMREDGTVLPRQLTGLCARQQLRIERCVMQAHWAGLFPDKTVADFDRAGYKRLRRYWDDDMDMYRMKEKVETGTWYYIKRYKTHADNQKR